MSVSFKGYFIQQADYQHWANEVLFAALDRLDDGARQADQGLAYGSPHRTVDHMLAAVRTWFNRLQGAEGEADDGAPLCPEWQTLKNELRHELRGLQRWLEGMPEGYFDERVFYAIGGERQSLWVRDALTQLMTHLSFCRGQATAAATRLGLAAPEADYVRYKREMEQHIAHLREAEEERRARPAAEPPQ